MQLIFIIDTTGDIQYKNDLEKNIKQIFVTKVLLAKLYDTFLE